MLATALPMFVRLEFDEDRWWNVYSDGTRLPLIAGGGTDDDDDDDADTDDDDPDDDSDNDDDPDDADADKGKGKGDDDEPLGPKGIKALEREKERRKAEAERRRKAEARVAELEAAATKKGDKGKGGEDDDGPDADAIREEARREAKAEALRERSIDRIEARAGRTFEVEIDGKATKVRFGDPEDAIAFLRDKAADFIDGDKIDSEAIDEALVELLEKKPRLGEAVRGKRKFDGDADAGARKSDKKRATTLGGAIEKRMTAKS